MKFVPLEEARAAKGLRLVVVGSVPSPWSEAAKGIFHAKNLDVLLVRFNSTDETIKQWTGAHNAPVLLADDEPPRTHWSDILESAERRGGRRLIPADPDQRARMFGLAHELLGENGLVWSFRLLAIHRGITTEGREGFPLSLARRLGAKYGYAPERIPAARERALDSLRRFGELLENRDYLLSNELTALDIYLAAALGPIALMPVEQCPGHHPRMRDAFASADPEASAAVPHNLQQHRDRIYQ